MALVINGEERRLGLALSGGGFRAAAFHLGTFRKLEELGLLWKIDLLTCVSGGSIAGAFLATRWGSSSALDELEDYLGTRSIAVSSVVGGLLDPFASRLEKLESSYRKHLFGEARLEDFSSLAPRLYINTTNLSTGNLFFFVVGGGRAAEMGEHQLGVVPAKKIPLARAVAASSAFPPVFPPLKLGEEYYPVADVEYVTLTDGGLYDNLGVNPLFRARNNLDYALVSDAGKPFEVDERPTDSGIGVLKESLNILMEQVRGLQFARLELSDKAGVGPTAIWFSIDSTEGQETDGDARFSSSIRTNLKQLDADEMSLLRRHAGALLVHRLRKYAPELL